MSKTTEAIKEAIKIVIEEAELWCEEESEHHYIDSNDDELKIPRGKLGNSGNKLVEHLKKTFKI